MNYTQGSYHKTIIPKNIQRPSKEKKWNLFRDNQVPLCNCVQRIDQPWIKIRLPYGNDDYDL